MLHCIIAITLTSGILQTQSTSMVSQLFTQHAFFCLSSLRTRNGVNSSTADTLGDAASFCPGQTGSVHGRVL